MAVFCGVLLPRKEDVVGKIEERFGRKGVNGQKDFNRYDIDHTAHYAIWNIDVDSFEHWRFCFRNEIDATWAKMKWG
jgi:hypothetical protein